MSAIREDRALRRVSLLVIAGLLSTSTVWAQAWTEFASLEDRFTCNFPGAPEVEETTWLSEMEAELPARIYHARRGEGRYSVTVVDYSQSQRILTERAAECPPGAERCSGGGLTGEGYWRHDVQGAMLFATWKFLQREGEVTHLGYNNVDRVAGHQLHLTNPDGSRTFASIYMHEDKLYVMEGTVPAGRPDPGLFQQSLGWLDEEGISLRYESIYANGFPAPPRVQRGPVDEGHGRIDAPGATPDGR